MYLSFCVFRGRVRDDAQRSGNRRISRTVISQLHLHIQRSLHEWSRFPHLSTTPSHPHSPIVVSTELKLMTSLNAAVMTSREVFHCIVVTLSTSLASRRVMTT